MNLRSHPKFLSHLLVRKQEIGLLVFRSCGETLKISLGYILILTSIQDWKKTPEFFLWKLLGEEILLFYTVTSIHLFLFLKNTQKPIQIFDG